MKHDLPCPRFIELCRLVTKPIQNSTPSSGCEPRRWGSGFGGVGNISAAYWGRLRDAHLKRSTDGVDNTPSRRSGMPFDVSMKEAWEQFLVQHGRCALTGLPLDWTVKSKGMNGTASLDRIDSTRGYTVDNVQWVHKEINAMKSDMDEETFKKWCRLVAKHARNAKPRTAQ